MWSVGGAVLLVIVTCVAAITTAIRRFVAQVEPARRSCDLLHTEVTGAVRLVSRDTGRATAGRRLLLRRGSAPPPR